VPVILTGNLVKQYGKIEALKGVSITVDKGEIYGLLGQNGAGKTTLIKILLGITKATHGEASLLEEPVGTTPVRKRVGYLPEDHRFPDYHTGSSLLDFYGSLLGIKDYKIRTYSKGMKQRLGLAQAMMHDPEVIFLDEPTDGVDPVGRREIREIMQRLRSEGKTLFLNSHLLSEVELICDRVGILQKGQMIREGDVETLTQQHGLFVIGLAPGQKFPRDELLKQGYSAHPAEEFWEIELHDGQTIDPVVDLLRSRGLNLRHLTEKHQSLEDLFIETVEAAEPGVD
jgi:ABC-2 type transport system ATP-binding protein